MKTLAEKEDDFFEVGGKSENLKASYAASKWGEPHYL